MKVEQGSVKSDLKNQQTGKSKTRHYKKREKKSNKVKCDKTKKKQKKNWTHKKGHTKCEERDTLVDKSIQAEIRDCKR